MKKNRGADMKVKFKINNKIYEVIEDKGYFYEVRGLHLGIPFMVAKTDCEVINDNLDK